MSNGTPKNMMAKFGLSLSTRAILFDWGTLDDLINMAELAEESGCFHGVWVGDNFLSKPRVEALVTLSALATRTERVKLGTICLASFPMREPILFALQWASLDILSKGRTLLTVCNGGTDRFGPQYAHELRTMGITSRERVGRVVEGISVLRQLWGEGPATHKGKYHQFTDVDLQPKPIQTPMPIHLAVNPPAAEVDEETLDRILRRVATHADGWQTDGTPIDDFRDRFATIRQYAEELGRDTTDFDGSLHMMVNINEDEEKAFEQATTFLGSYYGAGAISRERAETWIACGSPQSVIDKIAAYIEAGCTMPVLRFVAPNPHEQLHRCIEEVLPAFRV
ncbi:MAG: LLM class flavin-dependent oxidoreductase [Pseudomonadota bacterium]|nr:LLM class flavin-dependent oxidoreductase [Pseudomonadota bacterium]